MVAGGGRTHIIRSRARFLAFLVACTWILLPRGAAAQSGAFTALPISGVVLDDASGQPLANTSIIAFWMGTRAGQHVPWQVAEATSDRGGRFTIPAWGPRQLTDPPAPEGPFLFAFMPGYRLGEQQEKADQGPLVLRLRRVQDPEEFGRDVGLFFQVTLFFLALLPAEPTAQIVRAMDAYRKSLPGQEGSLLAEFEATVADARARVRQFGR